MKKDKVIRIICLVVILLAVVCYFGVKIYLNKDLENKKQDLQDTINKYGYVEKEDVSVSVSKFNTVVMDNDITELMAIYYSKGIEDETMVINYVKSLIKANNENLTDSDIDYLIDDAKYVSNDKKISNNGKGISVGYVDNGEKIEYQVIRLYK